jgi:hypothetical protein
MQAYSRNREVPQPPKFEKKIVLELTESEAEGLLLLVGATQCGGLASGVWNALAFAGVKLSGRWTFRHCAVCGKPKVFQLF